MPFSEVCQFSQGDLDSSLRNAFPDAGDHTALNFRQQAISSNSQQGLFREAVFPYVETVPPRLEAHLKEELVEYWPKVGVVHPL